MAAEEEDEDYFVPLHHKKAFGGAGIKRKPIHFVPETSTQEEGIKSASETKKPLGDVYLSIVLGKSRVDKASDPDSSMANTKPSPQFDSTNGEAPEKPLDDVSSNEASQTSPTEEKTTICPICELPLTFAAATSTLPHEANLAHQIHLSHSHPPSALDRQRKGFAYLSSYGWDPDSQTGLGASGREGRLYPVKSQMRDDNRGIGATAATLQDLKRQEKAAEKLDAKKVRKLQDNEKLKQKHLNDLIYGRDDVNKYLGIEL